MSGYGSLFERLAGETHRYSTLEHSVKASVAAHLSEMLSTRAGSVQTLPDYGVPDMNDMELSLHDAFQQTRSALESFIETYESRLTSVAVTALENPEDPTILEFDISGTLLIAGIKRPVNLHAKLGANKRINIR